MQETSKAEIIPAIMPTNRDELFELAEQVSIFANAVQLDVMDGAFAHGISWPLKTEDFVDLSLPYSEKIVWEVHLMVKNPYELGELFIKAGAKRIIAHMEVFKNSDEAREAFDVWHSAGAQVGASILLDTPISVIEDVVYDVEVVQIMGIAEIGAQGHPFEERAIARVQELHNRFPQIKIAVDGGIKKENASELVSAGATRLCVGSAIMKTTDPKLAYEELSKSLQS
jgi:ribulose-phosphate 3-epimerase